MKNEEYNVGDKLICIPGFADNDDGGGAGYITGRIFTVARVTTNRDLDRMIYWPKEHEPNTNGIYGKAAKLYTLTDSSGSMQGTPVDKIINNYQIY